MPRNLESFSEDSTLKDDVRIKMAAFRAANWQTIGGGTLLHAVTHPAPTPTSRIAAFDLVSEAQLWGYQGIIHCNTSRMTP